MPKAFDTLDCEILLNKLNCNRIQGPDLSWLNNYLTNKTQKNKKGNTISQSLNIKCGLPEGSVLGPLLFYDLCK